MPLADLSIFPQLPTGFTQPASIHTGMWCNPRNSVQGFDVRVMPSGRGILYWYTYNIDEDSRRFYLAVIAANQMEYKLFTTEKGTFDNPSQREETQAGVCHFRGTADEAHFHWYTEEHGRGVVQLKPLLETLNDDSRSGVWQPVAPNMVGSGFSCQFFGNRMTACWYTYGTPKRYGTRIVPFSTQRWYLCVGEKLINGTYRLDIWEYFNTWMGFDEPPPDTQPVGTAEWSFFGSRAKFDYVLGSKTGVIELEQIPL